MGVTESPGTYCDVLYSNGSVHTLCVGPDGRHRGNTMSTKEERAARLEKFNKDIDEFQAKINAMAEVREGKIETRKANYEERIVTARTKRDASKAKLEEKKKAAKDGVDADIAKVQASIDGVKAKMDEKKDAHDQKKLEKYIDKRMDYVDYCVATAAVALDEAYLAFLEALDAAAEYDEKYGKKD